MEGEEHSVCGSITLEEWNGSSSTKLFRTATITASSSLSIQRLSLSPPLFSIPNFKILFVAS